jgi:regulatory protein
MSDEAFERALEALGRRERTGAELEDWLAERGFAPEDVAGAIERLDALGGVDDARFARRYAEDKRELSGWGAERIREALAARGVAAHLVEAALAGESRDEELQRAIGLLRRRGERLGGDRGRGRALAYLTRRGYDYEIAYEAVRAATPAADG